MRYFVQFSYLGKNYHGWQNQPNAITVQQVLEEGFATLLGGPVPLMGAGRTDAGVHAGQMFAHFDCDALKDIDDLVFRLNAILPDAIAVQDIFEVAEDAHARFHAVSRTYEYHIVKKKDPFNSDTAHYVKQNLDLELMNQAAAHLLGRKDFECFSKSNTEVYTNFCDVKKAIWTQIDNRLVFSITADRFLRNMVRAIVGTLLTVGTGKHGADYVNTIIKSKDRGLAGASVPAKGLYLISVIYPNTIYKNNG